MTIPFPFRKAVWSVSKTKCLVLDLRLDRRIHPKSLYCYFIKDQAEAVLDLAIICSTLADSSFKLKGLAI